MGHFAQLDSNNVVTQVIVVSNDDTSDSNHVETESIGVAFCQKLLVLIPTGNRPHIMAT